MPFANAKTLAGHPEDRGGIRRPVRSTRSRLRGRGRTARHRGESQRIRESLTDLNLMCRVRGARDDGRVREGAGGRDDLTRSAHPLRYANLALNSDRVLSLLMRRPRPNRRRSMLDRRERWASDAVVHVRYGARLSLIDKMWPGPQARRRCVAWRQRLSGGRTGRAISTAGTRARRSPGGRMAG